MNGLPRNQIAQILPYAVMSKITEAEFVAQIGRYFPPEALSFSFSLFDKENFRIKITPHRRSKKGDFRLSAFPHSPPLITINSTLSPYEFLVVYLHEVAHYMAYKWHPKRIAPHGKEWKAQYRQLFHELLSTVTLPSEVKIAFETHLQHVKSSSASDGALNNLFYKDSVIHPDEFMVKELQPNDLFLCQKKVFRFERLVRTRVRCIMIRNNKPYLVPGHVKVLKIN
ncbi:MAG: hypothetical protein LBL18_01180 [Bacteroidales bacterium]|nr:hypothetical protein [Bacteroidales bacterium]